MEANIEKTSGFATLQTNLHVSNNVTPAQDGSGQIHYQDEPNHLIAEINSKMLRANERMNDILTRLNKLLVIIYP